jgi:hypothetical protein
MMDAERRTAPTTPTRVNPPRLSAERPRGGKGYLTLEQLRAAETRALSRLEAIKRGELRGDEAMTRQVLANYRTQIRNKLASGGVAR